MHSLHEHGSIFGFLRGVGLSECTNIRKGEQHLIEGSKWVGRQADRPKEEDQAYSTAPYLRDYRLRGNRTRNGANYTSRKLVRHQIRGVLTCQYSWFGVFLHRPARVSRINSSTAGGRE